VQTEPEGFTIVYPHRMSDASAKRLHFAARGQRLEYFTIGWNAMEGTAAVAAGVIAGSISLTAFGIDSFIEVTSGAVLLWRMSVDANEHKRERNEGIALRLVGVCFLALAVYVSAESIRDLLNRNAPEHSVFGIVIACISLIVMSILSRAKKNVGAELNSAAMHADAKQTDFCVYLSAILLFGLGLNAILGWWWADPVAGLVMVPIIGHEGYRGLRAETCD
jgi:divalent metal cation (Fe/Co/Zn/Cd) transporter